ncbi:MAG TPA: tol-pal system protein YbgF [Rhizobiaceae bacterium]|nr:tol-pal system protein YbgF [Rhizobiaceae bacterium]
MKFRAILNGACAVLIMTGAAAFSGPAIAQESGGLLGRLGLPGVFGSKNEEPARETVPANRNVQFAQAGDPRITALEEQVRQLSGTIEELNFQILQMQEQMRKMQEDNEFRFQELEKRGDGGGKTNRTVARAPDATASASGGTALPDGVEDGTKLPTPSLGNITVAPDGTVKSSGGSIIPPADGEPMDSHDGTTVASLPSSENPEELYRNSYEFILSGDYSNAEAGFRDHINRFPSDARTSDAHFWLGESLLGQQKYRDAAEVFLAANKDYPDSKKAPDMLFKLGVSLAGLNQRDVACATFSEVGKRYPAASGSLKERVKQEQAATGC